MQRLVFIKHLDRSADAEIRAAHIALWRNLARAPVPGMPAILDLGIDQTGAFMVTEWLEAETLHVVEFHLHRIGGDVSVMIETLLAQSLETLAALHDAGFVHGDIAPGNIMISHYGDRIWLIDPAPSLASGGLIATRAWAAPELLAGQQPAHLTDLFALGCVIAAFAERNLASVPDVAKALSHPDPRQRPGTASEARLRLRVETSQLRERLATSRENPIAGVAAGPDSTNDWRSITEFFPHPPGQKGDAWGAMDDLYADADFCLGLDSDETAGAAEGPVEPAAFDPFKPLPEPAVRSDALWNSRTSLSRVPIAPAHGGDPVEADFIVMGPATVTAAAAFPLELWMGPSALGDLLRERAQERGRLGDLGGRSRVRLPSDQILTAQISLPGFSLDNPIEHVVWDGSIRNIAFLVQSPDAIKAGEYWGTVKLLAGSVPLGMVSFHVTVGLHPDIKADPAARLNSQVRHFRTAFASYASHDRAEVFKRVQAIRASQVDVYSDIADLRGGDLWKDTLMREIASRDVFYLFWSRAAAKSKEVEREWQQALDKRGAEFICPIPLEDPRLAPPPASLAHLHFNDWCLAIIQSEQAVTSLTQGTGSE
jgi:serine/threonine protein kinase